MSSIALEIPDEIRGLCDGLENFIKAEVIAFDDYVNGGEQAAKDSGKMRQEGKEYVVADGDVILFRFNV